MLPIIIGVGSFISILAIPSIAVADVESHISRYARMFKVSANAIRSIFKTLGIGQLYERWVDYKVKSHIDLHRKYGYKYGVDPALSAAIEWIESRGDKDTIRYEPRLNTASVGLMQLLIPTARETCGYGDANSLKNIDVNIMCGVRYLAKLKGRYDSIPKVISAYNAGRPITGNIVNYVIPVYKKYEDFKVLV